MRKFSELLCNFIAIKQHRNNVMHIYVNIFAMFSIPIIVKNLCYQNSLQCMSWVIITITKCNLLGTSAHPVNRITRTLYHAHIYVFEIQHLMWWEWNNNPSTVFYDTHRWATFIRNRLVAVFYSQEYVTLTSNSHNFAASQPRWCTIPLLR